MRKINLLVATILVLLYIYMSGAMSDSNGCSKYLQIHVFDGFELQELKSTAIKVSNSIFCDYISLNL